MSDTPHLVDLTTDEGKRLARSFVMAEMGRKGGLANKNKSQEKCRNAARVRWAKYRAQQESDKTEEECE